MRAAVLIGVAHVATAQAQPSAPSQGSSAPEQDPPALTAAAMVFGGAAGLGLAAAVVAPTPRALGASDELVTSVAGAAGLTLGLISQLTAHTAHPGRLRASAGSSTAQRWEYSLAYRVRVVPRIAVEAAMLVNNETWEATEVQQRCNLGICITGDVIVDARYEQVVSALARVAFEPWPESPWRPSLAIGGGPARVHVDRFNAESEERGGGLFDATLAIEPRGLTVEAGIRVGALDTRQSVETAGYFRLGYTWGRP